MIRVLGVIDFVARIIGKAVLIVIVASLVCRLFR